MIYEITERDTDIVHFLPSEKTVVKELSDGGLSFHYESDGDHQTVLTDHTKEDVESGSATSAASGAPVININIATIARLESLL